MARMKRGVIAAIVLWLVGFSVALTVRQVHGNDTSPAGAEPDARGPLPVTAAEGTR